MEITRAQKLEEKYLSFYISYHNKIKDEWFGNTILSKINIKDISKEIAIADHMVDAYYKFLCSEFLMPMIYRNEYYYGCVLYLTEILFPQKILEVYTEYKNVKPLYYFKTPEGYTSCGWLNHKLGVTTPVYFGISLYFLNSIESMVDWINDNKKLFQYKHHLVEDQYDELYHSIKYPITIPDFENLDLSDLNKSCEENRKSIFEGRVHSSVLDNETRWKHLDEDLIDFFKSQEYISLDNSSITKAFICEDDNRVIQNSSSFKNMIKRANKSQVEMFKSDYQIKDVVSKSICITIGIEDDDKSNMSYINVDIPVTDKFFELDKFDRTDWVKLNITDLIEIANRNISTFDNINQHMFFYVEIIDDKKLVRLMFRTLDYRKGFEFYRKKIDSVMRYLSYKELVDLCDVENFIDLYVKWWTKEIKEVGLLPDYIDIYRKVEAFFWNHILSRAIIKDHKTCDIIDVSKVYNSDTAYRFVSIMVDNSKSLIYTKTFNVLVEKYNDGEEFYKYLQSTEVKKKFRISPSARQFEFTFGLSIGVSQFINDCYPKERYKSFMIDTLANMIKNKDELEFLAENIGSIGITVEEFGDIIHNHMRDESQSTHTPVSILDMMSQHPDIHNITYTNPTIEFKKYTGSCLKFDFIDVDVCINTDLRKESMPIIIETVKEYIPLITEIVLSTIEHKKLFKESHLTRNDLVLSKPYILPDGTIHYSFDIKGHLLPEEYPENEEVDYNGFGNPVKICGLDKESRMRLRFDKRFFLL